MLCCFSLVFYARCNKSPLLNRLGNIVTTSGYYGWIFISELVFTKIFESYFPKKSLKAVIRNRSKAMEDFDMTKVHQDDDYIYPSLELSDDEMEVGPSVHIGKYKIHTGCPT